jgi:hypothetical protein
MITKSVIIMPILNINSNMFCPNGTFMNSVVDILCNRNGIFQASAKSLVEFFYDDMRQKINCIQYRLYPLPGNLVQNGINPSLLTSNGHYYAGHDLPVWLNDPTQAKVKHRLLIVSQDPRRNVDEMNNNKIEEIGISTPFGLHSMEWRSVKSQGLIHWVVVKLFNESGFGNSLSVYYTDVYKFRGVDDKSKKIKSSLDKKNSQIYYEIFKKEKDLFDPTIVLLMGDKAEEAYYSVCPRSSKDVKVPHQAPTANGKWKEYLEEPTSDNKIEYIYNLLLERLRTKI